MKAIAEGEALASDPIELPEEELGWCTVRLQEAIQRDWLLKAAVFDIEGRHASALVEACKWPVVQVAGRNGLAAAFYPSRFKRLWVEFSDYPIYQPGQITDLNPQPTGYLSPLTKTNLENLRARRGQILMTRSGRSGSIGRTAYVSRTLDRKIMSDDVIRIECADADCTGYLYAFLSTKTGRALVRSHEYGAMIPHIEPTHLESVPVPDPPVILKKQIHDLVIRSYALRDDSNALLEEAESLLYEALMLPHLSEWRGQAINRAAEPGNYAVNLSRLAGRLDAAYHVPVIDAILHQLRKSAAEITTVGDPRVSKRVVLPGRFARVYVEEGQGVPFFGGKQIHQLDPTDRKFLSLKIHGPRIREQLALEENMVLVTCSGTIGKVALAPRHWKGFAASQHIIRIVPSSADIAGFLYVFLATEYGRALITRFSYGSTVSEIDAHHVSQVAIPLLKDRSVHAEINRLALAANAKRTEAYHAEQRALHLTNERVIHASERRSAT